MRDYPIIGIAGPARAGKDTVADFIQARLGGYRYSFADPIRAMLVPLGIDMTHPYWQERKEEVIPALGVSPRYLMQTLGTEWGRNLINRQLWVILAKAAYVNTGRGMIISDVRFEDEAQFIRSQGGRVVHVERQRAIDAGHESERGIEIVPGDFVIMNSGTLEDLHHTVMEMFG